MKRATVKRNPARADRDNSAATASSSRRAGRSLCDTAYDAIKHRVVTCALRPGQYINEMQISDLLGIGRTPVHQALDRLKLEGMVDVIPRKGVIVRPMSFNEIMQILEVRLVNEIHSARLAAERADDEDLARLDANVVQARQCLAAGKIKETILLDREFHLRIADAARNPVLTDLLRNLNERSARVQFMSVNTREHFEDMQDEHDEILIAIRAHSPDAAEGAMRRHVEAFRTNVVPRL